MKKITELWRESPNVTGKTGILPPIARHARFMEKHRSAWRTVAPESYYFSTFNGFFTIKYADMKKYVCLLVFFFSALVYGADKGTWTGYISDSHCGAKGNNPGHASCAKECIKNGYAPVFVVGDKVYTISDPKKVSKLVGEKVTISGTINGDAIDIEKVSKEKS